MKTQTQSIERGSRWVNKHTGASVSVVAVGPASDFGGETRVLSSGDLTGGDVNNGWSVEMWLAHWRPQ